MKTEFNEVILTYCEVKFTVETSCACHFSFRVLMEAALPQQVDGPIKEVPGPQYLSDIAKSYSMIAKDSHKDGFSCRGGTDQIELLVPDNLLYHARSWIRGKLRAWLHGQPIITSQDENYRGRFWETKTDRPNGPSRIGRWGGRSASDCPRITYPSSHHDRQKSTNVLGSTVEVKTTWSRKIPDEELAVNECPRSPTRLGPPEHGATA